MTRDRAQERGPSFQGQEVDVVIVGSGAGGAPVALTLARAGMKVVVLEKGPWYEASSFNHDEIENSRRDKWVPFVSDEPHMMATARAPTPVPTTNGWTANCVGGGTVHMSGFFYRLHPEDFALRTRYKGLSAILENTTVVDWPIRYEDLAPYYARVEREVGISGEAFGHPFEPPREAGYPYPPLAENPLCRLIDRGAKSLGLHPFKTPRAILPGAIEQDGQARGACVYCDFCGSYGCESGAKGSTMAALVPRAVATGRCEIRPDAMAFEIATDKAGRATGVRYYDSEGAVQEQRAKVVVVSATSVESARLLLNSTSARHPRGLGNGNGLVGRNLTFSTLAKGYGIFERGKLEEDLRAPHPVHFLQRSLQDHYFLDARKGEYDKGGTMNFILPHRNPIFTAQRLAGRGSPGLWGAALQREIHRYYTELHELEVEIFGEFLPTEASRVTVDSGTADKWGIPVATIHLNHYHEDLRNSDLLLDAGLAVFKAAGATSVAKETAGDTTYVLQHGTCRFGDDRARSVLDVECRSWEVDNLYVVDGSFMPTSGGVPTTWTIMANAFRVADLMVERLKKGTLKTRPAPRETP